MTQKGFVRDFLSLHLTSHADPSSCGSVWLWSQTGFKSTSSLCMPLS